MFSFLFEMFSADTSIGDKATFVIALAGLGLSCFLAVAQWASTRLKIRLESAIITKWDKDAPKSTFVIATISNKTRVPFSLVSVSLKVGVKKRNVSISNVVRTYRNRPSERRAEVEPVVLSAMYPVRFDAYKSCEILIEVDHPYTNTLLRQCRAPKILNLKAYEFLERHRIRKEYIRQFPVWLVLHTSRGQRVVPLFATSVQGDEWFEGYAVRRAGYAEKIAFPSYKPPRAPQQELPRPTQ